MRCFLVGCTLRGIAMAPPDDHGIAAEGADGAAAAAAAPRFLDTPAHTELLQCAPFSVPAHADFLRKSLAICDPEVAIGALYVARREVRAAWWTQARVALTSPRAPPRRQTRRRIARRVWSCVTGVLG